MNLPNFRKRATLLDHIKHTKQFYDDRCIDPSGGLYHFYKDDGTVYDHHTRHLVSSTRFVFNYAMAYRQFGDQADQQRMQHALTFLRTAHRNPANGGYIWELRWEDGKATVTDPTNHCYGLAFVLLAYSHALLAGAASARADIEQTYALMEQRFWQADYGLYADEADSNWQLSGYRGQNANMHACEAMLAAFEATGDKKYLHRAETLAHNIAVRQSALAGGLMWEHYRADWSVDGDYNRDDKTNIFRPWGYQPGHLTEWAKLLLIMERHKEHMSGPSDWLLPRALELFDAAMNVAWDHVNGGICYGFAPDGSICDGDKYFWVQAESLATAALLAERSGDAQYWTWYDRIWAYSWTHMIDHKYGAWYRVLSQDNGKLSDEKSPAGKVDYHTMGACYEALNVLKD